MTPGSSIDTTYMLPDSATSILGDHSLPILAKTKGTFQHSEEAAPLNYPNKCHYCNTLLIPATTKTPIKAKHHCYLPLDSSPFLRSFNWKCDASLVLVRGLANLGASSAISLYLQSCAVY